MTEASPMANNTPSKGPIQTAGRVLRYIAPILMVALSVVAARALIAAKKAPPTVDRAARVLPVQVATAEPIEGAPTYEAYGVVRPLQDLSLRPIVGGPVTEVHPNMIAGGRVSKGEVLLRIDPRDFELSVDTADAALLSAKANLAIEEGQAAVAESEWKLLEGSVETTPEGKSLALREPYLAGRQAELKSAEAQLELARLNLSRTAILAPFDAIILSEAVEVGAEVSPGTEIARLVETSSFLVEVTVPAERTAELDFGGAEARVRLSDAAGAEPRQAQLLRMTGEVDTAGRMAVLQVVVSDPLDGSTPLLLGSYVRVDVPLIKDPGVLSIPRAALREGDVVWLPKNGTELAFQDVTVALRRDDDVLITSGLEEGQQVIVSSIVVPLPGTALRVVDDESPEQGQGLTGSPVGNTAGSANQ